MYYNHARLVLRTLSLKILRMGDSLSNPVLHSEEQKLAKIVVKAKIKPCVNYAMIYSFKREDYFLMIDILMATYNGEKYLREQIDSILEQSYTDFRLLISDDCSTDKTRNILNEYVEKDNRVVVFLQNKNLGVVKNFEYLMNKVESEYFMFSDQDDFWYKDKIKKSLKRIEEMDCDLVYSDLEVVNQNLDIIYSSYWKLKGFYKKIKKYNNFESLYLNNFVKGSTMLVKSKWIEKILPLPEKSKYILHDYWTALIVSRFGKMAYIDEPLVKYRQHIKNRIGSQRKSDQINDFEEMRNLFIDVKKDHFKTFMSRAEDFDDENLKNLDKIAYQYFYDMKNVKNINIKNSTLFWKLYKYEEFSYNLQNYLILNMPMFAKFLFSIKKGLKRK